MAFDVDIDSDCRATDMVAMGVQGMTHAVGLALAAGVRERQAE